MVSVIVKNNFSLIISLIAGNTFSTSHHRQHTILFTVVSHKGPSLDLYYSLYTSMMPNNNLDSAK